MLPANAQVVRQPLSVRYAGLGAYSKNFSDIFSATSNQASLAQLKSAGFGVYGERRFMLEELNGYSAVIAVPTSSGTIGFQGDYFGSAAFNESQLGFLYARKITAQVDIGVKFNYHTVRIAGYGTASAINFEGGAIFHLTDKLHTGIHVYNPTSSKLGKTGSEKLASVYRFGVGYEASEKVFLSTEIVKQEDQQVSVNAGLQYNLHERVFIRTGISTLGNNSYVGIGLQLGFARIDLNTAYHPQLGFTPGLLLLINFKQAEKE
ncbi:MAG: hypothetical protein JWQ40_2606 [Segetibacter sp.]|nr:hypothetical protein [Segetibacter sp.]